MAKALKLPTFRNLWAAAWHNYKANWLLLMGVAAVVAVPAAILNLLGGSDEVASFTSLAGLFMNLALLWSILNLNAKPRPGLRQAYYQGTARFVVFFLVFAALAAMTLPLLWGISLYSIGISSIAAISLAEKLLIGLLGLTIALPSLFLVNRYFLALFAVLQTESRPIQALRHSKRLTKGRGWWVFRRNLLFIGIMILLLLVPSVAMVVSFEYSGNAIFLHLLQLMGSLIFLPFSYLYWHAMFSTLNQQVGTGD